MEIEQEQENNVPIGEFMDIADNMTELNFSVMRERLFTSMLNKLSSLYLTNVSKRNRKFLEYSVLYLFLVGCGFLTYLHFVLHSIPEPCLKEIGNDWPKEGILRIEVVKNLEQVLKMEKLFIYNRTTEATYFELKNVLINGPSALPSEIRSNNAIDMYEDEQSNETPWYRQIKDIIVNIIVGIEETYTNHAINSILTQYNLKPEDHYFQFGTDNDEIYYDSFDPQFIPYMKDNFVSIVEFSYYHGLLRLHPTIRQKYNIPVHTLRLDPKNSTCFTHIDKAQLMVNFIGYEESLIVSLKYMAGSEMERGYFRDILSGEYFKFVYFSHPKRNIVIAIGSMLLFTLLISLLLRYSHQQIFVFIMSILRMFELNVPINSPIAPLITVILALVGMEAIMSEVFHNTSTAFYVIMIVWAADQFDAIVCRHPLSKKYWLRYFFLSHCSFYVYQYGTNGYFPNLTLFVSTIFIVFTMIKIYHDLELTCFLLENLLQETIIRNNRNIQDIRTNNNGFYYFAQDTDNKWYMAHLKLESSNMILYEEGQINIPKAYKNNFNLISGTHFPSKSDLALCIIMSEDVALEYFNGQVEPGFFNYKFPFLTFSGLTNERVLDRASNYRSSNNSDLNDSNIILIDEYTLVNTDFENPQFIPSFFYDLIEEELTTIDTINEDCIPTFVDTNNQVYEFEDDDDENDIFLNMILNINPLEFWRNLTQEINFSNQRNLRRGHTVIPRSVSRIPQLSAAKYFRDIVSNAISYSET